MAPKEKIRKKSPRRKRILSKKKVGKQKVKEGLQKKARRTSPRRTDSPQQSKSSGTSKPSPATETGRPSKHTVTEEAFLKNVPPQLRAFAFRPGHKPSRKAGRPKGSVSLTTRLRCLLATPIEGRNHPKGKARQTYADEFIALGLQAARRGDPRFFQYIYDRIDGKIPDHLVLEKAKEMVQQEGQKLAAKLVEMATAAAEEMFGEQRGKEFSDMLSIRVAELAKEPDASSRAS
jgi:hypothetical protein